MSAESAGLDLDEPPQPPGGLIGSRLDLLGRGRRLLIGRPRASDEMEETLLPKTLALPIFSSDPIHYYHNQAFRERCISAVGDPALDHGSDRVCRPRRSRRRCVLRLINHRDMGYP